MMDFDEFRGVLMGIDGFLGGKDSFEFDISRLRKMEFRMAGKNCVIDTSRLRFVFDHSCDNIDRIDIYSLHPIRLHRSSTEELEAFASVAEANGIGYSDAIAFFGSEKEKLVEIGGDREIGTSKMRYYSFKAIPRLDIAGEVVSCAQNIYAAQNGLIRILTGSDLGDKARMEMEEERRQASRAIVDGVLGRGEVVKIKKIYDMVFEVGGKETTLGERLYTLGSERELYGGISWDDITSRLEKESDMRLAKALICQRFLYMKRKRGNIVEAVDSDMRQWEDRLPAPKTVRPVRRVGRPRGGGVGRLEGVCRGGRGAYDNIIKTWDGRMGTVEKRIYELGSEKAASGDISWTDVARVLNKESGLKLISFNIRTKFHKLEMEWGKFVGPIVPSMEHVGREYVYNKSFSMPDGRKTTVGRRLYMLGSEKAAYRGINWEDVTRTLNKETGLKLKIFNVRHKFLKLREKYGEFVGPIVPSMEHVRRQSIGSRIEGGGSGSVYDESFLMPDGRKTTVGRRLYALGSERDGREEISWADVTRTLNREAGLNLKVHNVRQKILSLKEEYGAFVGPIVPYMEHVGRKGFSNRGKRGRGSLYGSFIRTPDGREMTAEERIHELGNEREGRGGIRWKDIVSKLERESVAKLGEGEGRKFKPYNVQMKFAAMAWGYARYAEREMPELRCEGGDRSNVRRRSDDVFYGQTMAGDDGGMTTVGEHICRARSDGKIGGHRGEKKSMGWNAFTRDLNRRTGLNLSTDTVKAHNYTYGPVMES